MYASMKPHLIDQNAKETDIVSFPWETEIIETLTAEEEIQMLEGQKLSEAFFARWDARKSVKA